MVKSRSGRRNRAKRNDFVYAIRIQDGGKSFRKANISHRERLYFDYRKSGW